MFAIKFGDDSDAVDQPQLSRGGNYEGLPQASRAVQLRLERQKSDQ
jgi:hypothetical protein